MTSIADLPDAALLRIIPACPPLDGDQAAALSAALGKLCEQFAREGRCGRWAVETQAAGALTLVAWEGPPLSGCSHDKIGKVLALHEQHSGALLLAPPPLLVDGPQGPEFYSHADFRVAVLAGGITLETMAWDTLAADLGAWRRGARRPIAEHWLLPLWRRATAAGQQA